MQNHMVFGFFRSQTPDTPSKTHQAPGTAHSQQPAASLSTGYKNTNTRKQRTKKRMVLPDIGKVRAPPLLTILLLCTVLMGTVLFGADYKEESVSVGKYKKTTNKILS